MKKSNTLKKLLFAALVATTGVANAQTKALHFYTTGNNWFSNYVGVRVGVTGPTGNPTIGDKQYTISNDGVSTSGWAAAVTIPIVNVPIAMVAAGGDTIVNGSLAPGSMLGKIAFIYRGTSEFGHKAAQAKIAGAVACVIVNNIPGGPVGMGAGAEGGAMTKTQSLPLTGPSSGIPVVMISKEDGDAIDAQYRGGAVITMTITNWGAGNVNDLGFVPGGASMWHAFAVPADQLASGTPEPYKAVDGAFIANYGSANATGVDVSSSLSFTPTGGSASVIHTSTVTLGNFAVADSVIAMFDTLSTATNVYSLPAITGTGRYDQTFSINATTPDDYIGDNTITSSFYATDTLYSKGRYDFVNKKPFSTQYSGRSTAADVIWGNMYYVNKGGAAVRNVQYSFSMNTTTAHTLIDAASTLVYMFKWVDANTDGVLQNGELTLVGLANHNYDVVSSSTGDTSGGTFSATEWKPQNSTDLDYVKLQDNTWYYLAVQVPSGYFVGCDGVLNQYPRIYGHFYNQPSSYLEYSNLNYTAVDTNAILGAPTDNNPVMPYTGEALIQAVDSFNFDQTRGLIPSISMIVNKTPTPIDHSHDAVNNIKNTTIGATVFPNPAANSIVVSLELDKTAPVVTYTIVDGLARFVGKETTYNVKSDKHTINTSKLPAGNYNLIITANGDVTAKQFTIVK